MLPTLEDAQKSACLLSSWGSILADCENPKLAYDFLRCVMDISAEYKHVVYSGVKGENV